MKSQKFNKFRVPIQSDWDGKAYTVFNNLTVYCDIKTTPQQIIKILITAIEKAGHSLNAPKHYKIPETLTYQQRLQLKEFIHKGYKVTKENLRRNIGMHKNDWEIFVQLNDLHIE